MSAVAKLLAENGWQISGSDEGFYPPISTYLEENNLPCTPHYSADNIPSDATIIVVGKHAKLVPEENEEVKAAFASSIPIKSFPDVLHELTAQTKNFVVAGSFGKSTCVSLVSWALTHAGSDPSYFIGAIPLDLPTNAHQGQGDSFILEGDEYPSANWDSTSKFLHYNPSTVLLTSGEHDHYNVFSTLESYLQPYIHLLMQVPPEGIVVACLDGENVSDIVDKSGRRVTTYSLTNSKAEWYADRITRGKITEFDLVFRGNVVGRLTSNLLGDHNIQNMIGVAAWLLANDAITFDELAAAFAAFRGVKRRLELKTTRTSVPVYEDFGSSRAKLLAGIRTIRQYFPDRRLIVLFEPHTFSFRNREAITWYDDMFADADIAYIYQPPAHGATTHDQLSQDEIVARVIQSGTTAYAMESSDQLLTLLHETITPNDVILIETSGEIDGAIPKVTDFVAQKFRNAT